jgi:hypothetical protein
LDVEILGAIPFHWLYCQSFNGGGELIVNGLMKTRVISHATSVVQVDENGAVEEARRMLLEQ